MNFAQTEQRDFSVTIIQKFKQAHQIVVLKFLRITANETAKGTQLLQATNTNEIFHPGKNFIMSTSRWTMRKTEGSASCPSQKFNIGSFTSLANSSCFSTAIALGSSAIVKVSGQNCFGTLYGSLSQIYLGKVPPRFSTQVPARVHHGSTRVLSVLGC